MENYPDDLILSIRTSEIFRTSVYFIDILIFIAIGVTCLVGISTCSQSKRNNFQAVYQLYSRQIFSTSTNYLLIFDFIAINIHNFSYVYIQNWSLYRSFYWSQHAKEVMFRSEECWPHHVANEYTKTVTLFVQFALITNRITVTMNPIQFSKAKYAVILSIATLLISSIFTINEHARGPFIGLRTTSCFRESDVRMDWHTEHFIPYIVICTITIVCSFLLILYVKKTQRQKTYDVTSQYIRKESMISTIAVVIIGLIQLATFSFYDLLLTIYSSFAELNPGDQDANVIGWFYTSPFNAVFSPSAVLYYAIFIRRNRKKDINSLTKHTVTHNDHFQQLSVFWNKI